MAKEKKCRDRQIMKNRKLTGIDLFCGAGGMSYGFSQAGVKIIMGLDNDEEALSTYKHNFSNTKALLVDLMSPDKNMLNSFGHVDFILGGPPCQGFSIAGKRLADDPRNLLTQSYLHIVKILTPTFVIIENVPNILSLAKGEFAKKIISGLESLGYYVEVHKLNAAEFGVPQSRRRVFFIGSKNNILLNPFLATRKCFAPITTFEAISDLPLLEDNLGEEIAEYESVGKSEYQKMMRNGLNILYNHTAVDHKSMTKKIISMVPDGGNYKNLPIELQATRKVNIAWTRMNSKKPCFTIDAGHNHHFHYRANRVPTVRECARIQSFPDEFVFKGKRTSQYRQVGNAVPPILAQKIAEALIESSEVK